ncbi:MAG: hypothetical protein IJ386_09795, partial [Clostridia bacterium]|nr:hypothetical protein [Clostridia bacterium]
PAEVVSSASTADSEEMRDAAEALLFLGYSQNEITKALSKVGDGHGTENIIRAALARLTKN